MGGRRLVIDERYRDSSGIGRYAREVVPRLGLPHASLTSDTVPTSKRDVLNRERLSLRRGDLLYSPGFAAGPTRAEQVVTVHDLLHISHPRGGVAALHRVYYERVLRPAITRSGHVITVSPTSALALREWLPGSVEVHDCGNATSEAFTADGPAADADRPFVLFVGNLKPHKRPELALDAIARTPGIDLVMVTSDRAATLALAAAHGVRDRVRVVSGIDDAELAALYRAATVLLFTSSWEGFGMPVLESMRCGTPVICAQECSSAADIAIHDPASVVIDAGATTDDWADAIVARIDHPSRSQADEAWLASQSWEAVASRVSVVLRDVLDEPA